MGTDFFTPIWKVLKNMVEEKTISKEDLLLVSLTDDIEEASCHIKKYINNNYKTTTTTKRWWFGEI
jgi:predicted Rossmann-fold nucleotide-binding protein